MRVDRLILNNFRGVKHIEIDFSKQINVLVGVNGAGKSTILEALAILLSKLTARIESLKGTGQFFTLNDIRIGSRDTQNTISLYFENEPYKWIVSKAKPGKNRTAFSRLGDIRRIRDIIWDRMEDNETVDLPLAVFYSVHRVVIDVPARGRKVKLNDPMAAYDQALTGKRSDFKQFFNWFRGREDLENENARYRTALITPDDFEFPDRQLEAVRSAIESLMPGYTGLKVKRSPLRMVLDKNGKEIRVDQLSDGEKCLLSLVGDIARRLALANPSMSNPLFGSGIVLIDEVDLHLHPAWQRSIVHRLTKTFPNCQFIVSTHSPQILGEVEPDNVFFLYVDEREGDIRCKRAPQTFGLTSNQILDETMEASSRNERIEQKIDQIFDLIDDNFFQEARNKIANLKKILNGPIPDIIKAETMIAMLDNE